ncbi:hypothetical protein N9S58_00320 [Candidatus Pelagibacter sp.]|nr:hypothetical protein [Candidatus Pelagibacter sp.]
MIPEKGRLLQCNSCDHQWFFKKEIINKPTTPVKIHKSNEIADSTQLNVSVRPESLEKEENFQESQTIELLDKTIKNDPVIEKIIIKSKTKKNEDSNNKVDPIKKKKKYNILGLIIVFIISFVALIVVLDTFQEPIGKIVPNVEFLLYSLYETINDIVLFLKDLI